ncbi:MAG: hypothetical protein DCF16_01350 [Alphaproteobacteria bacterium]|nr:MAG: hypothetical protein DCF16_01350 [Alphaproteobacteria bacterium]
MTTVTLRQQKKNATRQKLAGQALDLFARNGVDAVTIDDIARAADVGKGTLYNYYGSKEEILLEFLAGVEARALPKIADAAVAGRTLDQVLNNAAWTLLACKAEHHDYARLVLSRLARGDDAFKTKAQSFSAAVLGAFTALFARLKDAGLVAEPWAADDLALRFTVMHMGLSLFWAMDAPPFTTAKRLTKAETEIFAKGIAP